MLVMYALNRWCKEFRELKDEVGDYIQSIGGEFHVARHDIEFTFEEKYKSFVLIKFPFLKEISVV
jgi:hypothetical protein